MNYIRPAFGAGLGIFASLILFTITAIIFFVPGFVLVKKENSKPKEKQNFSVKVLGYILMAIGMGIGMGFGAGIFFGELGGEF
jgi:hypothetical protein